VTYNQRIIASRYLQSSLSPIVTYKRNYRLSLLALLSLLTSITIASRYKRYCRLSLLANYRLSLFTRVAIAYRYILSLQSPIVTSCVTIASRDLLADYRLSLLTISASPIATSGLGVRVALVAYCGELLRPAQ
jgi:hypothetical protein